MNPQSAQMVIDKTGVIRDGDARLPWLLGIVCSREMQNAARTLVVSTGARFDHDSTWFIATTPCPPSASRLFLTKVVERVFSIEAFHHKGCA